MQTDPFHAEIIESTARALGAHAAEFLLETHPNAHAFGTPAFRGWQEHLTARLHELAGTMRAGEPTLFGAALAWGKLAFESRGLDTGELVGSVEALRVALREGLPPSGEDAVEPYLRAARSALVRPAEHAPPSVSGPFGELAARYLVALLEGDRRAAIGMLIDAMDDNLHPRDVLLHVIVPTAREIGRMWHLGEVGIGEEHFCTATASLLMGVVRQRLHMADPNGRCVVIASVPGNRHELAGRIAGLLLEAAGWRVIDLGTEMPPRDLVEAAGDFRADVVVLGAMLTTQVETARVTLSAIRSDERTVHIPVIVGGHVFDDAPGLWRRINADAHARTIGQVVELADALTRRPRGEITDG
jgi:MerR family transcriptional regulator, light-induced transcriptional regulator